MEKYGTIPDMGKIASILVSFVGNRDPYPENSDDPGPILSFLIHQWRGTSQPIDYACLLCSSGAYLERGRDLEKEAKDEGILTKFNFYSLDLSDVVDYDSIWARLQEMLPQIRKEIEDVLPSRLTPRWIFLLDSGTPQMKGSLLLMAATGLFPASLVQGIPPSFAGGSYKAREVSLKNFPFADTVKEPTREPSTPGEFFSSQENLIGSSLAFTEVLQKAQQVARYEDPVLLLGETGTGKSHIAKEIHKASPRCSKPFLEVNCSTIQPSLAESELFGHVRGAFTGAHKDRSGKFLAANGGTLFLDEIGDLPLEVQVKLLKALEEKEIIPVGSDEPKKVDVRLIAATHQDLARMVKEGKFRHDLYQRLKVVVLKIPPLRERKEDIIRLSHHFIEDRNRKYNEHKVLSESVLELFQRYPWPGNVRELKNAIDSSACIAIKDEIDVSALPEEIQKWQQAGQPQGPGIIAPSSSEKEWQEILLPEEGIDLRARLLQVEWSYVAAALRRTGGNREAAAKLLGMTGHAFRKALRERLAGFFENEWEGE